MLSRAHAKRLPTGFVQVALSSPGPGNGRSVVLFPASGRYARVSPGTRFATHVSWGRGGLEHEDVSGWVMDLKPYVAKGIQPDADGVLAYTAFQDRLLQLSKNRVGQNSDAGCMLASAR